MRQRIMIAAAVGAVLLIILTLVVIQHTTASPAPPRSYTVPELAARLRDDPQAWTGRTVLVQGQLVLQRGMVCSSVKHLRLVMVPCMLLNHAAIANVKCDMKLLPKSRCNTRHG